MTRRIVIDTDPGQDDAVAILTALASPELDVVALTTVAGNVPLALTTRNALMMCELAGRLDVPVYAGCDRPMARDLVTAEYVHGLHRIKSTNELGQTTETRSDAFGRVVLTERAAMTPDRVAFVFVDADRRPSARRGSERAAARPADR